MAKDECEIIQVRDTEGRLIEASCALTVMEIVQRWEAEHPGVPLLASMDSNAQGPILWLGIVAGPGLSAGKSSL